jgi:hypothetical protein
MEIIKSFFGLYAMALFSRVYGNHFGALGDFETNQLIVHAFNLKNVKNILRLKSGTKTGFSVA